MRKPIVALVYAVSCAVAVCGGFIIANSTHTASPENIAHDVDEPDEELFGHAEPQAIPQSKDQENITQERPQQGVAEPEVIETPEATKVESESMNESAGLAPAVAPAGSGRSGNAQTTRGPATPAPAPMPSQQFRPPPHTRQAPPPEPAADPPAVPDIPFPTLTINHLPVNPPQPEPLRPLRIG